MEGYCKGRARDSVRCRLCTAAQPSRCPAIVIFTVRLVFDRGIWGAGGGKGPLLSAWGFSEFLPAWPHETSELQRRRYNWFLVIGNVWHSPRGILKDGGIGLGLQVSGCEECGRKRRLQGPVTLIEEHSKCCEVKIASLLSKFCLHLSGCSDFFYLPNAFYTSIWFTELQHSARDPLFSLLRRMVAVAPFESKIWWFVARRIWNPRFSATREAFHYEEMLFLINGDGSEA